MCVWFLFKLFSSASCLVSSIEYFNVNFLTSTISYFSYLSFFRSTLLICVVFSRRQIISEFYLLAQKLFLVYTTFHAAFAGQLPSALLPIPQHLAPLFPSFQLF